MIDVQREQTITDTLVHPEWVDGKRLWMDSGMRDVIHKLHHGDPVKGWEGDPALAVYWNEHASVWELWRLEHDGEYRMTCRSKPGVPFDDRLIDALIANDRRRRTKSLHDEVVDRNARKAEADKAARDEWVAEEVAPRLRLALRNEGA